MHTPTVGPNSAGHFRSLARRYGLALSAVLVLVAASWGPSSTSTGAGAAAPEVRVVRVVPTVAAIDAPATVDSSAAVIDEASIDEASVVAEPVNVTAEPAWPSTSVDTTRLVLVGDSLAEESSDLLRYLTALEEFVRKYWGGTAPCDWVDDDLEADQSTIVVIQFTGNSLTPCMSDGAGGHLQHEAFAAQYRADLYVLITRARRAGARVLLVGQPQHTPVLDHRDRVDAINAMLQEFAAGWDYVSYVDAGAAVETPEGEFTERLPCMEFDTDCAADGTTVVRGDGVHFCPVVGVAPCPVYSSGALRFSLAIADAVSRPADFE